MNRLLIVIFFAILLAGCTSTPSENVTPNITETITDTPTPSLPPTEVPTTIATELPTPTPIPTTYFPFSDAPIPTGVPTPQPSTPQDASGNWVKYNNSDFQVEIPASWQYTESAISTVATNLNGRDLFKPTGRSVRFFSDTNLTSLTAKVYDFVAPGSQKLNQNIADTRAEITREYPDVTGEFAVQNYQYYQGSNLYMVLSFDVVIPPSSKYFPYSYSEEKFVTYNHLYVFDFVTTESSLTDYRALRDRLMGSIVAEQPDSVYRGAFYT